MIPARIPRAAPDRSWQVFLVETMTGRVGSLVPVAGGSWVDAINDGGEIKVKVPTSWLLKQPRWRWSPWSGALLACFDGQPIALGPIISEPDGDRDFTDLAAGDLWHLLEHRVVTDRNYEGLRESRYSAYLRAVGAAVERGLNDLQPAINQALDTGRYDSAMWQSPSYTVNQDDLIFRTVKMWWDTKLTNPGWDIPSWSEVPIGTVPAERGEAYGRALSIAQRRNLPEAIYPVIDHTLSTGEYVNYGQFKVEEDDEIYDIARTWWESKGIPVSRDEAYRRAVDLAAGRNIPEGLIGPALARMLDTGVTEGPGWSLTGYSVPEDDYIFWVARDWWERSVGYRLANSTLTIREGSLGTIARRLVERCQDRPNGWLPISYGSPEERGDNRVRNYEGFNLGNNSVAKRIKEITEVINGPDISFRPRWVERGNRVEWVMFHGTEGMPEISQSHQYVVDLTAPRSNAVAAKVSAEWTPYSRAYASGDGQDKGTLVRIVDEQPPDRLPLLETVLADSQTSNPDLLEARGRGVLDQGRTVQMSVTVDDPLMPLHTWWAGDEMTVPWPAGWPQLDKGTYRMRVLKRSGNFADGRRTNVEFMPEELVS